MSERELVLSLDEVTGRWESVRRMMDDIDLDLLVAVDSTRDEIMLGHQRWLTGYIPIGGPAAVLIGRNGSVELISERIGKPVTEFYQAQDFPIELVSGFSAALLAERIARQQPRRIGIAEAASFPFATGAALSSGERVPELIDVSRSLLSLRLLKSGYELDCIRRSCAIADAVWERIPEIFRVGRRNYEIVADVDHLVRLAGAEGGFHLVLPLPFLGRAMVSLGNPDRIAADANYLLEISPRFRGYYSQLTIPVSTNPNNEAALRAYNDVTASKQMAAPLMKPGADLSQIAVTIAEYLAGKGRAMSSLSLGHFCGMALEEPRHDPKLPFILAEGMTLIFHPVLADPAMHGLMRAETYLITSAGAESLNRYPGEMLTVA
jgi:Xaa-Pro aminopeptidase